ncbi:hypothetical protein BASA81_008835 [Batrachochytrium salamandrivorans]|nr:hypothetical protein BASA81_008835 [Batrachochytrium salamandrivorans]
MSVVHSPTSKGHENATRHTTQRHMIAAECTSPGPKLDHHHPQQHFVHWEFENIEQAFGSSSPQSRPQQQHHHHRFASPPSTRRPVKSPLGRGKRHSEETLPPTLWTVKMLVELAWELWNSSTPQSPTIKHRQD